MVMLVTADGSFVRLWYIRIGTFEAVFAALQLMQDTKNAPVSPKRTRRCQNFFHM